MYQNFSIVYKIWLHIFHDVHDCGVTFALTFALSVVPIQIYFTEKGRHVWTIPTEWVLKVPDCLSLPMMANLVLAASNHAPFLTSTWSAWASAPHDLLLVTEASV